LPNKIVSEISSERRIFTAIIHVPGDQPTIQAGISAAGPGDTVLVDPGTYNEKIIINKALTLAASGTPSA